MTNLKARSAGLQHAGQTASTVADEPRILGYRDLLARALRGDPNTVLVSDTSRRVTRGELATEIEILGRRLLAAGCGPEILVALRFAPGVESIIAILAVLSTGAAYLPLDPSHGDARIEQILTRTAPDFVLSPEGLKSVAPATAAKQSNGLADLAYVISTSGSTGQPKAAELEQRGLVIHTEAMIALLDLSSDDVVLQTAPPSFDIAVWQCTTPQIAGARVHVATDEQRLNPKALWQLLIDEQVTVVQLVPSMLRMLLANPPPRSELALRHVISTGEALHPSLANQWFEQFPGLPLINMYGPAECSDDVSVHTLTGPVPLTEPVPIGQPFAGAILRVVDDHGRDVPEGNTGTLQVCGDVVGRGYRNDPERTARVFSKTTINERDVRTYDTGDLVYLDDTGLLHFVGRSDFQVKIRGNRVELGEIESTLTAHPDVDVCVVTKFDDDTDRLVAHVATAQPLARKDLRATAAAALPTYMVPSAYVIYDRLPLNVNGKIDRHQLRAPTSRDLVVGERVSQRLPVTPLERALARNWSKLLGLDEVPVDADFFDLGGTSLLAVMSIEAISIELGYEIPTQTFITAGTIEAIAAATEASGELDPSIDPLATGLVQIQHDPSGTPLFLYPGEAVSALGMVELARLIEPGRSIYVFEPARPINGQPGPSMSKLAERCRSAIDEVHPDGPVHLAGFCMGGDVAWEIAHQREALNQPTASVTLLQTERDGVYPSWPSDVSKGRIRRGLVWQRLRFEAATMRSLGRAQRRSHLRHLVLGKAVAKLTMPVEKWLHGTSLAAKFGVKPSLRLRQHEWALIDRAAYDGWAPRPVGCSISVIAATEQPPLVKADPTLGWSSTGSSKISVRAVPGFHWSFLHRPAVVGVAAAMSHDLTNHDAQEPRRTP